MRKCILAFLLCIPLAACKSEAEREQRAQVQTKSSTVADGLIHLSAEQINTNHIQTTAAVEEDIVPTVAVIGRIKSRAGAEAQVFAPFAGKVLLDAAQTPS